MQKTILIARLFRIILITLIVCITLAANSQSVAINNTGTTADNSAMLDISSTTKGMLIPRMRTIERTAIAVPAEGLLVYDIDTRGFWYYTNNAWNEIPKNAGGGSGTPTGPAGGDLSGVYPTPSVVKIQNLDVASGIPFDKQVMKWDMLNNRWKGENDSLFLPYNVSYGSATKLFGISNTNNTTGATAIYGRSGSGIGILPQTTMGVWGDNSSGAGVVGTSNTGIGTYGFSFQNYGVYGYGTNDAFSGIYGSHANAGAGVMGEVSGNGKGIHGRTIGTTGKAAFFENTNTSNADTTFVTKNAGLGSAAIFLHTNASNGNPLVNAVSNGVGDGYYAQLNNTGNTPNAAFRGINNSQGGYGVYAESGLGRSGYFFNSDVSNSQPAIDVKTNGTSSAGNFTITNTTNSNYILQGATNGIGGGINASITNTNATGIGFNLSHSGTGHGIVTAVRKGKAAVFSNTDNTSTNNVMEVTNIGTSSAAIFTTNNSNNNVSAVNIVSNSTGRGLQVNLTNVGNNAAAVYGFNSGTKGLEGVALNQGVVGQSLSITSGIGVYGEASPNSPIGIGVKGVSSSTYATVGSVTGINNSSGNGVYGEGNSGAGVYGFSSSGNGLYGWSLTGNAIYGYTGGGGNGVFGYSLGSNPVGVSGLAAPSSGQGAGIVGSCSGNGNGVDGHAGSNGYGVYGESVFNGIAGVYGEAANGYGVKGVNNATLKAAVLGVNAAGDGVAGTSNGSGYGVRGTAGTTGTTGAGVYGVTNPTSTTGRAGLFEVLSASHTYEAVRVNNAGFGATLNLNSSNSNNSVTMVRVTYNGTGDFIVFEDGLGANLVRFSNSGRGYFNGGTQTGGADMAEAFDVNGNRSDFEPGDVLVISVDKDRTVEKSSAPYSSLVSGVYATKPGVLMTEENIDADLSDKVPMGVLGVIPTKVCIEGGEIKRGDLLVTSTIPGVAMKADINKVKPGQVIGKALENFNSSPTGKIKVLVNVK